MKKYIKLIMMMVVLMILLFGLIGYTNVKNSDIYVITYTDGYGDTTVLNKKPERIVSVSPNITEILCSIGLESKIVGRTEYCDYPETVNSITTVGDILNPSIEKIVELKPDLVLSEGMQSNSDFSKKLRELGIPVINLRVNTNLEGTYKSIKDIGIIASAEEAANTLISNMKKELNAITIKLNETNARKKTVFYVVGFGEYGLSTATGDTYVNELLELAGLINISEDGKNWSYSVEKLFEKNPDYIICSKYFDSKEGIRKDDILKDLPAVKNENIVEIDNNLLDRQTARNIDGIKELVKKLYDINM